MAAGCASLHPSAAFPGSPSLLHTAVLGTSALPLRNVCALSGTWEPQAELGGFLHLTSTFLSKSFCKAFPTGCAGALFLLGGEAGAAPAKGTRRSSVGEALTLCRQRAKGWLLSGRRTVQLPVCVPFTQAMETFPWLRAVGKPAQKGTAQSRLH